MGRTTATVLFTDLVGSTELRARFGEDPADELRRRHDKLLAQAVEAHDGRVVKGLGDGVMATFAGASDAVAAAVAIQQAVDRLNRSGEAPVPLGVRVGLSAGDVSFEDDDVHGTPVIEASRLCGAAVGGEILAGEVVRILAGPSAGHDFEPVGALELKGLDPPVAAVRIAWEPVAMSTIPMPPFLTDIGRIFVGRDGELERLGQVWKEAAAGQLRVALLAGEPGVGKTRLAAELAGRVHDEGAVVLAGRCDEDLGVPYQPFVEALRHFVDHAPVLSDRLGRYGGELARLVPELPERVPALPDRLQADPETERYRLFEAVAGWLAVASTEEPLLLVLDDLQWAAKPTLLLLRHVVRAGGGRVLILGTYRDTELAHDHPLVDVAADLRRRGGVERLSLSGLDGVGVAALVEQASGRDLDESGAALARAVFEETEGNPFFVREILRHLAETGAVERSGAHWATRLPVEELGIPEGVREVVGRRLARLSEDANQALRVGAVAGAEFELSVVQAASELHEDALLSALEEATRARLIIEAPDVGRYRFAHALVRDTLYSELSAARRVAQHRRVAEALEAVHAGHLDDYLPALAHQWARASAPAADTDRAVDYATRAGDRAMVQLAHDEAAAYYGQALELLEAAHGVVDDVRRQELLIRRGEAQRRAGDRTHRETLLAAAHLADARGDSDALARATLANSRGYIFTAWNVVDADKVAALESALRAVGSADSPARARLLATLALELVFDRQAEERRRAMSDEALTVARRLGDPPTIVPVLIARHLTTMPCPVAPRVAESAELVQAAESVTDGVLRSYAWGIRYRSCLEAGDTEEADRCLARAVTLMEDLGQPGLLWTQSYFRAGREIVAGHFDEAERLIVRATELGTTTGNEDVGVAAAQGFTLRFARGTLPEGGAEALASCRPQNRAPVFDVWQAVLDCECGRDADARAAMAKSTPRSLPRDLFWLGGMCSMATVAAALADATLAGEVRNLLLPYADHAVTLAVIPLPAVVHHLGLAAATIGAYDEAGEWFRAAVTTHERLAAPAWLARTRLEWARMLLTRRRPGDTDRARELLNQALPVARELGLAKIELDAVTLLKDRS
jgi:class 3 adenylate cyclase/tetratricopeptide (TPR) repeat protein